MQGRRDVMLENDGHKNVGCQRLIMCTWKTVMWKWLGIGHGHCKTKLVYICLCGSVSARVCVTSSRWRQGDHAVAEGDHSNTLFARRWCVLLCWMEFPTTGSVSVVGLRQWRVPLHGSSDRPMKLQRVNRVFFDPASDTNCSPHRLGLSAWLMEG